MRILITVFVAALALAACGCLKSPVPNSNTGPDNRFRQQAPPEAGFANSGGPSATADKQEMAPARQACMKTDTGDNIISRSQTFPIDFEPFKGACFVTSYNPEYDPPMESNIAVYRNGKKVFDFPEQFNGATFGCHVEAVAFQDVDHDQRKDIIVVGKCSAKSESYYENMIYINNGKNFDTIPDLNNKLGDFKTAREITDFVEENNQILIK
jgi:hypothetical protein